MNFRKLMSVVMFALLLNNCSSDSNEDLTPTPDPDPMGSVTYEANIKAIFTANCIQCHGNPPTQGAPKSYITYNQVKADVNTIISRINSASSPMPPSPNSPLSQAQKNLIQKWKDDGLLEN
jgi:mono/diheme cytochrome c family protein